MARTRNISFSCEEIKVSSGRSKINVEIEDPNIDELLPAILDNEVMQYVANNFSVDDVYANDALEQWAEKNGYTKE